MKVYKVELMVVDFDGIGGDGVKDELENARYGNRCIRPEVKGIQERDIGEWDDDHPLNQMDTSDAEYRRLFAHNADLKRTARSDDTLQDFIGNSGGGQ